ncbi:Gp49 family protein [Enterococcus faecium]
MNTPLYVREAHIKSLVRQSEKEVFHRVFGKLTIVVLKLPNGFTVMGQSGCVDPANYDEEIGEHYAMEQVEHELWRLEGYALQQKFYEAEKADAAAGFIAATEKGTIPPFLEFGA